MTAQILENRYSFIRELGSGGFGDTFLAEDKHMPSGRRCVVKRLKPRTDDPQVYELVKERFQREAAILEDLGNGHSQIPSLYAYFESDEQFYLIQEWVEGITLSGQVQQQGTLSESSVKEILVGILPVLEFIHSKHIVHRDIKPDNIIWRSSDNKPVLIDFGAVKESMGTVMTTSGNATPSITIGTPGFMPSEQTGGRPVFASDIYSLGLTAIYLLTGKTPQGLETNPQTGEIMWRRHALSISPSFAAVLDKAVQSHWRDRYHSASEMLKELQTGASSVFPPTAPSVGTEVSAAPVGAATATSQPPTEISQTPGSTVSPPPPPTSSGLSDWQKATLTGGIIGALVVGAIVLTRPQPTPVTNTTATTPSTDSSSSNTDTNSSSNNNTSNNTTNPSSNNTNTNTNSTPPPSPSPAITQEEAVDVIGRWQSYKGDIFAPPFNRSLGAEVLAGKAYVDNLGASGSVSWLQNNNAYYTYGVQQIDSIEEIIASGNFATVDVIITEERFYYQNGRIRYGDNTGFDTRLVRYNLQLEDGRWKIADYDTIRVLQER